MDKEDNSKHLVREAVFFEDKPGNIGNNVLDDNYENLFSNHDHVTDINFSQNNINNPREENLPSNFNNNNTGDNYDPTPKKDNNPINNETSQSDIVNPIVTER
ncbi:hypothetical protein BCR32DRAFT_288619 [Anaeromyces robustus]|uniref:Uncharacterized protein n=1 Tax=Anaeromyces robustus TaxID=1754192 RepID=A0A1Y1UGH7_9FUNG|nr:hypothetical protein BCR32DRAFT_288619 [Anaeromyces robustus]|eukprot:ORX36175.1 hypothetical protein BCR32DRAFT_288619 [Anaeromyces robustus]